MIHLNIEMSKNVYSNNNIPFEIEQDACIHHCFILFNLLFEYIFRNYSVWKWGVNMLWVLYWEQGSLIQLKISSFLNLITSSVC